MSLYTTVLHNIMHELGLSIPHKYALCVHRSLNNDHTTEGLTPTQLNVTENSGVHTHAHAGKNVLKICLHEQSPSQGKCDHPNVCSGNHNNYHKTRKVYIQSHQCALVLSLENQGYHVMMCGHKCFLSYKLTTSIMQASLTIFFNQEVYV